MHVYVILFNLFRYGGVKLPDNFQMREHSWPCWFHINTMIWSEADFTWGHLTCYRYRYTCYTDYISMGHCSVLNLCILVVLHSHTLYATIVVNHSDFNGFSCVAITVAGQMAPSKICLRSNHCINMKPARPWMLPHLKIIWQFHAHPVHQKVSRYIGDAFF
jgi:hypothetical protein